MNRLEINGIDIYDVFGCSLQPYTIPMPEVKRNIIEIEGADGQLDLSTVLTGGRVLFKNRQLDLKFNFINGKTADDFVNFTYGRKLNFTFSDEPDYFWTGF